MADVSVKMGVSGVSQFKSQMAQAQASVKNIDAQLKLNEKQYKATGDAETYMQNKTTQLNSKLQAQQSAVKSAEAALKSMRDNGVDPLSTSYQNMETQLLNAQSAVLDTQQQINELGSETVEAAGQTDQLVNSLQGLNKKISLDQVISGINSIASTMENAAKKAIELGQSIWDNIMDSAAYADDIATMALRMGLSTEDVQQMQYVAAEFEAPVEMMAKTWKKVKMNMTSDTESVTDAFKKLGVATAEYEQGKMGPVLVRMRDYKDVFWETGEAIMKLTDEAEQERLAETLLGRSWDELIPLFTEGREAYEESLGKAPTNSKEAIENAAELNDKVNQLKISFETFKTEIIGSIAPALSKAAETLTNLVNSITEYLKTDEGQEALERMGKAVEGLFSDLSSIDPQQVVQGFADVFDGIIGGLEWLDQNKNTLVTAMEVILGGWAAIKLGSTVLTLIKLFDGFKSLGRMKNVNLPNLTGGQTGTQTVTTQTVTTGNVTTQTVTTETVTNATVTNETVNNATIAAATITTGTVTTENVTTMYVANMVGGNGMTPGTNSGGGGNNAPLLNSGGEGMNGFIPLYGGGGGDLSLPSGTDVYLPGADNVNLTGGNPTLNLPEGQPIELSPTEFTISGDGTGAGAGAGEGAGLAGAGAGGAAAAKSFLTSGLAKTLGGVAVFGVVLLTPSDTGNDDLTGVFQRNLQEGYGAAWDRLEGGAAMQFDPKAREIVEEWAMNVMWANEKPETVDTLMETLMSELGYKRRGTTKIGVTPEQRRDLETLWDIYNSQENPQDAIDFENLIKQFSFKGSEELISAFWQKVNQEGFKGEDLPDDWFEVPASLKVPDDEADQLAQQVGVVTIPAQMAIGGEDGEHANGMAYIPFDGYRAVLHKGERVLSARDNRNYTTNNNTYFGTVNLNNGLEIEALTESLERRNARQRSAYGA